MRAMELTADTWERAVLQAHMPVLVDFWAPWCAPCRALGPRIEMLAEAYDGRVRVAKLNVDDEPRLAARYEVRSIPSLLLFRDGKLVQTRVGALGDAELHALLDAQLLPASPPGAWEFGDR